MSVDGSIKLKDTKNKYIFWDIDGTLAPYRFNDHVGDPDGTENGMSIEEINEHVFLYRDPSRHMQRY
jgi:FMN phosphatase YigB (HAD superfamily)